MWQLQKLAGKKKRLGLVFLIAFLFVLVKSVSPVEVNTNLTIRAACINATGTLCGDVTGLWTVVDSNGTTTNNNTAGDNFAYGVSNFTIWLNLTGVWYVYVNFTGANITTEYNIVVEETHSADTYAEVKMIGIFLILGFIIFGLLYASFQLSQEHLFMKTFFLYDSLILMVLGAALAQRSLVQANLLTMGDTWFWIMIATFVVSFGYLFAYILFSRMKKTVETAQEASRSLKDW